jgi:hypothetical protein
MKRAERNAMFALRKAQKLQQEAEEYERSWLAKEFRHRAEAAERTGFTLQFPGIDPQTSEKATDVAGEYRSAILWAKLLDIKLEIENLTCLNARIYERYVAKGTPLWNPFSENWSPRWRFVLRGRGFKSNWTVLPGSDSFVVDPKDFENESGSAVPEIPAIEDETPEIQVFQKEKDE